METQKEAPKVPPEKVTDVLDIVVEIARAKRKEDDAKLERIKLEQQLIDAVSFRRDEGQDSYECSDGNRSCKFTLKQPVNVTIDSEAWAARLVKLPKNHPARLCFRTKYDLDTKEARALAASDPSAFLVAAAVISRKPGKVSVDLTQVVS